MLLSYTNIRSGWMKMKMRRDLEGPQPADQGGEAPNNQNIHNLRHNKEVHPLGMWSAIGVGGGLMIALMDFVFKRSELLGIVIDTSA